MKSLKNMEYLSQYKTGLINTFNYLNYSSTTQFCDLRILLIDWSNH